MEINDQNQNISVAYGKKNGVDFPNYTITANPSHVSIMALCEIMCL